MKQIKRIAIIFTILMLASLYAFFVIGRRSGTSGRDIIHYNDLLYKICDDYAAGIPEEEIERRYDCILVLSKELENPELASLYASGALVLDLNINGEYIGKAAWDDDLNRINEARKTFETGALILWGSVLILGYILLYCIYLSLIRPVDELTAFSSQIAKGNLDVPLPLRKRNLFEGFTEAFDIMRIALKESRKREMESEMARKELVTKLSHDIKTPAAVIKATCEVLELKLRRILSSADPLVNQVEGTADNKADIEDTLDKLGVISSKADTISSLMGNVMHSTINDLEEPDVNTCEEDSRLIEGYFLKLKDYGNIVLENSIPPCLVYMDRLRMEQVIDNIIGNSYKYAGTDIHVSFSEVTDMLMADGSKGRFIKIRIRDFGPGADEEELPLLAEKYYRGTNSKEASGYGLGLYNVKWYMDKQSGGMDYYNDNGFVVELLLKKV